MRPVSPKQSVPRQELSFTIKVKRLHKNYKTSKPLSFQKRVPFRRVFLKGLKVVLIFEKPLEFPLDKVPVN